MHMTQETKKDLLKVHDILDQRIYELANSNASSIGEVASLKTLRFAVGILI